MRLRCNKPRMQRAVIVDEIADSFAPWFRVLLSSLVVRSLRAAAFVARRLYQILRHERERPRAQTRQVAQCTSRVLEGQPHSVTVVSASDGDRGGREAGAWPGEGGARRVPCLRAGRGRLDG
jgi:uncharacterized protein (DUF3084 family)